MWRPQLESLSDSFHCLAPDLPGHGRNNASFSLSAAAMQLQSLIRTRVGSRQASIVGLSLGGAVALELLRLFPQTVSRVMVSGTSGKMGRLLGSIGLATAGISGLISRETQARMMLRDLKIPELQRDLVYDDFMRGTTPEYTRMVIRALMEAELPEQIDCPLLVAVGGDETIPAKNAAKAILDKYSFARGIQVPGKHHLWNLEDPKLFSDTVRAWMTGNAFPSGVVETRRRA